MSNFMTTNKVGIIVAILGVFVAILAWQFPKTIPGVLIPQDDAILVYIYKDHLSWENHYPDITYMGSVNNGNDNSMTINQGYDSNPYSGNTCIKVEYKPTDESHWAGMMWLSGNMNFPPSPPVEGVDTSKVNKLKFWTKGSGAANFFIENDTFAKISNHIVLTDEWMEYILELPREWNEVCVGFGWSANYYDTNGQPMTFYVDEIVFTD